MSTTRIGLPSASISNRNPSVYPLTACLLAEYIACNGTTTSEASLPTLINTPPVWARWGNATIEPWTTPQKLMSKRRRLSSSRASSRRANMPIAASLTHESMRPNVSMAVAAIRSTSARWLTSAVTDRALPPAPVMYSTAASRTGPERDASTTLAPCPAAAMAVASPIPLDAPVITMTCSETGLLWYAMLFVLPVFHAAPGIRCLVGTSVRDYTPPGREVIAPCYFGCGRCYHHDRLRRASISGQIMTLKKWMLTGDGIGYRALG